MTHATERPGDSRPEPQSAPAPPVLRLEGDPRDRGLAYGKHAAEQIHRTRMSYEALFLKHAKWSWSEVRHESEAFLRPIEAFRADLLQELQGIADGSGLDLLDVLAMNLRTEILFGARVRSAGAALPPVLECTSFAQGPAVAEGPIVGQNWDWLTFATETLVILEVYPSEGIPWMTVVEAGLLAKVGMNAAGLVVATNALASSADLGRPGVPYHLVLRSLFDCSSANEARTALAQIDRASSANYLLADASGAIHNGESAPGGADDITWLSTGGKSPFIHTNHFQADPPGRPAREDIGVSLMSDSTSRLDRAQALAQHRASDLAGWKTLLSDHDGHPSSICCHPNPDSAPVDQWTTVTSVIFEPRAARAHISIGNPCGDTWLVRDYEELGWS